MGRHCLLGCLLLLARQTYFKSILFAAVGRAGRSLLPQSDLPAGPEHRFEEGSAPAVLVGGYLQPLLVLVCFVDWAADYQQVQKHPFLQTIRTDCLLSPTPECAPTRNLLCLRVLRLPALPGHHRGSRDVAVRDHSRLQPAVHGRVGRDHPLHPLADPRPLPLQQTLRLLLRCRLRRHQNQQKNLILRLGAK